MIQNFTKSILVKTIFLFAATLLFNGNLFSQSSVKKMIDKKSEALKKVKLITPFKPTLNKNEKADKAIKGKKEWLNIDAAFCKKILQGKNDLLKMSIPIQGSQPLKLELQKVDILTESFILNAASNKGNTLNSEIGLFYWGVVEGYENSTVAINIFKDEISGTIDTGKKIFTLAKVQKTKEYVLYQEKDLEEQPTLSCFTGDLKEDLINQVESQGRNSNPDNCVRLYVEVDYDLFSHFGTVSSTYNYIAGAFSQVSILYANESIDITLNQVLVWDIEDPYIGPSTSDYLDQISSAVSGGFNGDLAHLVGTKGGGGIAYLNALCGNVHKTGYSGINTSYQDVPSFSWTINVLTHEIGHNLGSPHTHSCSWNGNNTQIDDCGNDYANNTSPCYDAANPIIPQEGGTIMSYCHLNNVGMDFSLGFGQQPGDLIRNNVYNATCLSPCEACTEVGNPCDDGNPCTINDAIDSYCNCSGISTPDNDQDGFCGANDVDDSDPCVPNSCDNCTFTTISVTTDDYPGETSWEIVDVNGVVLYSGVGYTGSTPIEIRQICIPDGCYEFIMKDQYSDGLCCIYGNGSYSVTDATGNIIAEGSEFTATDITPFCYDNITGGGCTAGTACDDGNVCTTDDVFDANCNCAGTIADSDNDGVCDANDICPKGDDSLDSDGDGTPDACDDCNIIQGTSCSDGDDCTSNDNYDANCNCVGTFVDSDNDGICDANDICSNGDDNIDTDNDGIPDACDDCTIAIGTSCDDGNICTTEDVYDANCNCTGTFADADNDGVCDADDICPNGNDNIDVDGDGIPDACDDCNFIPGTSCSDGNDCTTNDAYDANCNCIGTFADSDNDGVCDANDICANGDDNIDIDNDGIPDACDDCSTPIGTACDDGNACTVADFYDSNCNCIGTFADADNDGVCDADDICPNGNDNVDTDADGIPDACDDCNFLPGASCNDGDVCTTEDVYDANCNCAGTFADSDNDGVCDANDICSNGDDTIDTDGDGTPDDCDFDCMEQTMPFVTSELIHQGFGATSIKMTFPEMTRDVSFSISDLQSREKGKTTNRFVDKVEISYENEAGNSLNYGTFLGNSVNSIQVNISEDVQSVTVSLSNEYEGNTANLHSVSLSSVTLCAPPCADDDDDGVCNIDDQCIGFDDNLDDDADEIPNGCDDCFDLVTGFPLPLLTHSGTGVSQTTVELGGQLNPTFRISGLGAKENGKPSQKYIDIVEIRYTDMNENISSHQIYSGADQTSAEVSLLGNIQRITVKLSNGLSENNVDLNINLSEVQACKATILETRNLQTRISKQFSKEQPKLNIYPNPTLDNFTVQFNSLKGQNYQLVVSDVFGCEKFRSSVTADTNDTKFTINGNGWKAGLYFVSLENSKQRLQVKRVVIGRQ